MIQQHNGIEAFVWLPPQEPSPYMVFGGNVSTANLFIYESGKSFANNLYGKITTKPTTKPYTWQVSATYGVFGGSLQFSKRLGLENPYLQRLTATGSASGVGVGGAASLLLSVQGRGEWVELQDGKFAISREFQLETRHQPLSCLIVMYGRSSGGEVTICVDSIGVVPAQMPAQEEMPTAVTTNNAEGEGWATLGDIEGQNEEGSAWLPKPRKRKK